MHDNKHVLRTFEGATLSTHMLGFRHAFMCPIKLPVYALHTHTLQTPVYALHPHTLQTQVTHCAVHTHTLAANASYALSHPRTATASYALHSAHSYTSNASYALHIHTPQTPVTHYTPTHCKRLNCLGNYAPPPPPVTIRACGSNLSFFLSPVHLT